MMSNRTYFLTRRLYSRGSVLTPGRFGGTRVRFPGKDYYSPVWFNEEPATVLIWIQEQDKNERLDL